ncbi:beta-ketoacyl-ACP reductase [Paenibacillus sp. 598K]|uniref:SDR family NAD(P)-dependent oxidoreductase n=1 Tax=Paenibacillus sp. 598K TaxID=1117987 RepID=UPI000FFA1019|nr:SDR family oxidoreductase [Paenibacillus sp. 598K]GBF75693.1 beta-ketoacyl-ACP reductase [Paenibacillus sp. 598K]
MEFAQQVVLVTGSGNGIGRSTAMGFAREGAQVVVADIDGAAAQAVSDAINQAGGHAIWRQTDVSCAQQVDELFDVIRQTFGVLDVLVNNVGITIRKPIVHFTEQEWDFIFDTNVKSMFLCAKRAGELMLRRGSGAVVNISSVHGLGGITRRLPYATSKSAVESLTKTLACEWAHDGVRVNCVSPGYIMTEAIRDVFEQGILNMDDMVRRTPQGRMGEPEDIAEAVLFLCSKRASFITGAVLQVDGGYSAYHAPEIEPSFRHEWA